MKKKKGIFLIILVFLAGLLIFLYPTISNAWNTYRASQLVADYQEAVEKSDNSELEAELKKAEDYNKELRGGKVPDAFAIRDGVKDEKYESLLNINGDGVIGYVDIPEINVKLPIYHYTTDEVLQKGAGHLFGSSLPVGGESTHAVISAHRGLPSAKLFTDLNLLKESDQFTITVLNRTMTYEVDQIKTVEPQDTEDLGIVEGQDYVTLLTCTPYGVNTQRLLVRGHRISNPAEAESESNISTARGSNPSTAVTVLCIVIGLAVGALVAILIYRLEKKKKNHRSR